MVAVKYRSSLLSTFPEPGESVLFTLTRERSKACKHVVLIESDDLLIESYQEIQEKNDHAFHHCSMGPSHDPKEHSCVENHESLKEVNHTTLVSRNSKLCSEKNESKEASLSQKGNHYRENPTSFLRPPKQKSRKSKAVISEGSEELKTKT